MSLFYRERMQQQHAEEMRLLEQRELSALQLLSLDEIGEKMVSPLSPISPVNYPEEEQDSVKTESDVDILSQMSVSSDVFGETPVEEIKCLPSHGAPNVASQNVKTTDVNNANYILPVMENNNQARQFKTNLLETEYGIFVNQDKPQKGNKEDADNKNVEKENNNIDTRKDREIDNKTFSKPRPFSQVIQQSDVLTNNEINKETEDKYVNRMKKSQSDFFPLGTKTKSIFSSLDDSPVLIDKVSFFNFVYLKLHQLTKIWLCKRNGSKLPYQNTKVKTLNPWFNPFAFWCKIPCPPLECIVMLFCEPTFSFYRTLENLRCLSQTGPR